MERANWKLIATGSAVAGMAVGALVVTVADNVSLPEEIQLQSAVDRSAAGPSVPVDEAPRLDERALTGTSLASLGTPAIATTAGQLLPDELRDPFVRGYVAGAYDSVASTDSISSPGDSPGSPGDVTSADSADLPDDSPESPDSIVSPGSVASASIDSPPQAPAPAPPPAPAAPALIAPPPPPAPAPAPQPDSPDSPDSPANPASIDS